MAFNTQEQEIIKYGLQNGKSKQEVEAAISNYRSGVVPKKKVETAPAPTEPSLGTKLVDRATTFGKEALSLGTLGASTISPQDIQEAKTSPEQRNLVGLEAFNRAFQAPAKMAMAAGGAIGDIVGAGLQATGIDKAIGSVVAPVATPIIQSEGAKKLVDNFHKLPQDTQDYLKGIPDIANLIGVEAIPAAVSKVTSKAALKGSAFDAIKESTGNLTGKALDFISNDPGAKVETILKRSTPQELDTYLNIAEKSAQSGEAKSVFEAVGDKMAETTKTLKTKLDGIGAAKSEVMKKNGNIDFTSQTSPLISQLEDIMKSFTEIDKAQAPIVEKFIADAKNIKTAAQADTFIDKAQDALYTSDRTMVLPSGSALEKRLQKIIGEYNSSLKKAVPAEYASLNEQYAKLVEALSTINKSLGDTFEGVPLRGSGLIKQYFSPAGSKTKEIFEFIKKETNGEVDLAKDATLAKFAGQLFDDPNVNSLLGGIKDIPTTASAVVGKVIEKVGGEKATSLLRQSTIRKAKSSTTPRESKVTSGVERKTPTEVKVLPSTESTTNSTASKGVRGMVNWGEWLPKLKSDIKVAESTRTVEGKMLIAEDIAQTLSELGEESRVVTKTNVDDIIENGKRVISQYNLDVKKKAMSTPGVKEMQKRFIKNPTTGKLEGSSKKVADSLEQEAKAVSSQNEWVKDTFWGKSIRSDATETIVPISEIGNGKLIGIRQANVTDNGVKEWVARIKKGERPTILIGNKKSGDKAVVVLDGNHRLEAYRQLGIKEIPIVDNTGGKLKRK